MRQRVKTPGLAGRTEQGIGREFSPEPRESMVRSRLAKLNRRDPRQVAGQRHRHQIHVHLSNRRDVAVLLDVERSTQLRLLTRPPRRYARARRQAMPNLTHSLDVRLHLDSIVHRQSFPQCLQILRRRFEHPLSILQSRMRCGAVGGTWIGGVSEQPIEYTIRTVLRHDRRARIPVAERREGRIIGLDLDPTLDRPQLRFPANLPGKVLIQRNSRRQAVQRLRRVDDLVVPSRERRVHSSRMPSPITLLDDHLVAQPVDDEQLRFEFLERREDWAQLEFAGSHLGQPAFVDRAVRAEEEDDAFGRCRSGVRFEQRDERHRRCRGAHDLQELTTVETCSAQGCISGCCSNPP